MENFLSSLIVENFQTTDIEDEVGKVEIVAKDGQTFVIAYQEEEASTTPKLKCLRCAFECTNGGELESHVENVHPAIVICNTTIRRCSNKPLLPIKEIKTKTSSESQTEKSLYPDCLERQNISDNENIRNKSLPCTSVFMQTRHCFMCSTTFKTQEELHIHFAKAHSSSQPSPIVNRRKEKKSKTVDLVTNYVIPKQPEKQITTNFVPGQPDTCCGQTFESTLDLGKHQINQHGSFYCTFCSDLFRTFPLFNKHIEKHHLSGKKYHVAMPSKIKLNEHLLLDHKPEKSNQLVGDDIEEDTDLTTNFILKPTTDANDFIKELSDWMKDDENGEMNVVRVEIVDRADEKEEKDKKNNGDIQILEANIKHQKRTKLNKTKITFLGIPQKVQDAVLSRSNHNQGSNISQTFPNLQSNQTIPTAQTDTQSKLLKVIDYQCSTCFKPFFSASQLQKHFMAKHMVVPVNKLDTLAKKAKNNKNSSMSQQMGYKRSYRCDFCDTSFKHNDSLTIHQRLKHSMPNSEMSVNVTGRSPKFECEFCAEIIPDQEQLEQHKWQKHMIPIKRRSEVIEID